MKTMLSGLKAGFVILLLCAFIAGCGAGGAGTNVTVNDVGNIEGSVTDSSTSSALSGVTVQIGDKTATTGSNGVYSIQDISVGTRTVTASKTGYQNYNGTSEVSKGTTVIHNMQLTANAAGDTTPPTVSSTSPAINGIDIAVNSTVTVTFSETMDVSTITTSTFTLKQGTTPVSGVVTYSGTTATFTPSSNLSYSTSYTATITTGAKDTAGNAMASNYSWSFITGNAADTTIPTNTTASNFINSGSSSTTSISVTLAISVTDAVGVTAYYASETSTTPSASASGWMVITATTSYSASVPFTLSSGDGTKTVYVWFKDAAGNVSLSTNDSINLSTGSAPFAPTGVSATAGNGQVIISWSSASGATSYNIYWSTTSGVTKTSGTKIPNATSPYTHTGRTNGTTYYYVLTAVNSYGESAESSQVSVVPVGAFVTTPLVAAGGNHVVVLKSNGTVWAWGANTLGQLGDGTATERHSPVQVSGLTNIIGVGGGWSHTVALKNDGTVYAWGNNLYSQLGDGTDFTRYSPVQVQGLTGVIAISVGYYHTMVLKNDGTVWTWGYGSDGQLGNGWSDTNTSTQVTGLSNVTAISAGNKHSVALKSDGTVWAWGLNQYYGQLGDGTKTNRSTPVQVVGLTDVKAVTAGWSHTVALKNDGTVWAWGANTSGQLGNGLSGYSGYEKTTPIQVSGLSNISAVFAGYSNTIAVSANGAVWIWGGNYYGQLGDGTYTDRSSPGQLTSLSNITAADIGMGAGGGDGGNVIAQKSDGTVWAWGNNSYGQLGDGTIIIRTIPVEVSGF